MLRLRGPETLLKNSIYGHDIDAVPINSYQYGCLNRTTAVNILSWMREGFTRPDPNEKSYRQLTSEKESQFFRVEAPDSLSMSNYAGLHQCMHMVNSNW